MNWKLIAVVLISLILLVICYLTIVSPLSTPSIVKNYFVGKNHERSQEEPLHIKKFKINFSKEEEFTNWCTNFVHVFVGGTNEFTKNGRVVYYFPEGCPNYKQGYFLVDTDDEGHENYHVPEDGYVIIVNKDHKWTKDPTFSYWKSKI
jgi:hypothetical protein